MAAAKVVAVVPPPPEPVLKLPDLAAAKAAMYLCLASLWVCCAGMAAAVFARHVLDSVDPVVSTLLKVSAVAVLVAALLIAVFFLQLLRAMLATGYGPNADAEIEASRKVVWEKLQDTCVLAVPACFPFLLLLVTGYPLIGSMLFDIVVCPIMILCCVQVLPRLALNLLMMN
ncbi:unnamed protein product [Urochloa decumbens]|uniref:Uncharacterized protein n=1 Tax=Urochloa decumbens TaxID=240449 RepID=A0ABC9BBX4_9POAL